ncbi:MAG TPA: hypothetical protein VHI98_13820 [Vicinamibacterales bacterium]|nr:hypothetical protein [Vicinamibacterales bacterium]
MIANRAPGILVMLGAITLGTAGGSSQGTAGVREIAWTDVAPAIQRLLAARGLDGATFAAHISEIRRRNEARVREGDLDHLIYYVLQSSSFTALPRIEPAVSAKAFVKNGGSIPADARARLRAFAAAKRNARDARLTYFHDLLAAEAEGVSRPDFLDGQYIRAMRFLHEKEFVAVRQPDGPQAVGALYQARGLSTDTSVEAGYVVYLGLATLQQLEPRRRIRSVLVVGPGLDVAPRTNLLDAGEPQSYQPFAVMDALLKLGLAARYEIKVAIVDINPRVVDWLERVRGTRRRLHLVSGVAETDRVRFTSDFRQYFESIGKGLSTPTPLEERSGRLVKSMDMDLRVAPRFGMICLDIVVDRIDRRFDLIVVTNVFPYLSDAELLLALTNLTAMLAPGGVLLHNEPRPILAEATSALRLALLHSRSVVIATVAGGESPLYDSIWMHRAPD